MFALHQLALNDRAESVAHGYDMDMLWALRHMLMDRNSTDEAEMPGTHRMRLLYPDVESRKARKTCAEVVDHLLILLKGGEKG